VCVACQELKVRDAQPQNVLVPAHLVAYMHVNVSVRVGVYMSISTHTYLPLHVSGVEHDMPQAPHDGGLCVSE
jgi:hypothetical protein